ncbi:membrane metallo-endopeptidase-like 1 [Amblyomma americanum]
MVTWTGAVSKAQGGRWLTEPASLSKEAREKAADSVRRQSVSSRRRTSTDSAKHAVICAPVLKVRRPSEADQELRGGELPEVLAPGAPAQQPCSADAREVPLSQPVVRSPLTQELVMWLQKKMARRRRSSQEGRSHGSSDRIRRHSSHRGRRGSRGSSHSGSSFGEQLSVRVHKHAISKWVLGCVVSMLVLVVVVLIVLIVRNMMKPPHVVERHPCDTEDCVAHARHILLTLNTSADPCSNFHAFVCGDSSSPSGKEAPSVELGANSDPDLRSMGNLPSAWRLTRHYAQVINSTIGNLRLLLSIKTTPAATVKAFSSLNHCLQRDDKGASSPFAEFMQKRDIPWPSKPQRRTQVVDILDALLQLSIDWRASLWLDVRLWYPDRRVKPHPLVVLDEPGHVSLLRMEQLGTLDDQAYSNVVREIAHFLTDRNSSDATAANEDLLKDPAAIKELRQDETAVRTAIMSTLRADDSHDELVSLDRAGFLLSNVSLQEWMDLLEKYLKPGGLEVSVFTAFLVLNKPHVDALSKVVSEIPASRLLNALGWTFAYSYSWIVNSSFDVFERAATIDFHPNYVLCFVAVHESFGISMDAALFVHLFPEQERDKVTAIVNGTAHALISAVGASRNVLNATKSESHAKIMSLASHELWPSHLFLNFDALDSFYAAFPSGSSENFYASWFESRKALRQALSNRYHGALMTSKLRWYREKIAYVYSLNVMLLGFAAIFPPTYLTHGNHVMTYAGLGFQFARQMVRSVDERGRRLDYSTGTYLSWWEENETCRIKKTQSARERKMIKDLFALEMALATMKKASAADGYPLQVKLLEKFSPMQTFYISYCSHFCGEYGAEESCGLARNGSEFARAFNCPRLADHADCLFI